MRTLVAATGEEACTAVLFLAGIFGERPKSAKEMVLATQRALEQQALERWRMQKEAQIEQMLRRGEPLGAVAAALASPETAERIALMEAATSGGVSALEAARLNVRRAGHDASLLDGLDRLTGLDGLMRLEVGAGAGRAMSEGTRRADRAGSERETALEVAANGGPLPPGSPTS